VTYRLWQNGVSNPGNLGYAKDWDESAIGYHIPVDNTPAVGAVAVWEAYSGPALAEGHVAYVDSINTDGSINISEDNYGGTTMRKRFYVGQSGWPDHFIHFKDLTAAPPPSQWSGVGNATYLGSDRLTVGKKMYGNQYIMSPDGRFVLMMQSDGNLVEYTSSGAVWTAHTSNNPGAWLIDQSDGNVVLYSASGAPLWYTGAKAIASFVVQDDANLVGYTTNSQAAWVSGFTTPSGGWNSRFSDNLTTGMTMIREQYLVSADGRYHALMQDDGNLVVYAPGYRVLWNSQTGNNSGAYIAVQSDGNFVIYASNNTTPLWWTGTIGIVKLVMQSDGNFVGYNASGAAVWYTNTENLL
jgi:hypothetical protein